jgi:hypothetical protein
MGDAALKYFLSGWQSSWAAISERSGGLPGQYCRMDGLAYCSSVANLYLCNASGNKSLQYVVCRTTPTALLSFRHLGGSNRCGSAVRHRFSFFYPSAARNRLTHGFRLGVRDPRQSRKEMTARRRDRNELTESESH